MKDLGISKIRFLLERKKIDKNKNNHDKDQNKTPQDKAHQEMKKKFEAPLPVLGWREWVALPEFGVANIKAKVDSGARTSALHAHDISYFRRGGKRMVRFKIYPEQRNHLKFKEVEAALIENRVVKSSIGSVTLRPVIIAEIKIGKQHWPVEITLVNRDLMGFRMLIGRQAIRKKYLIDPGKSYLMGKRKTGPLIFPF